MATIDLALATATQGQGGVNQGKAQVGASPDTTALAPPPPLSPGSSNPFASQQLSPEEKKQEAEQAKIRKHQEALLGKEQAEALEEARKKDEARKKSIEGIADALMDKASEATGAAQVKIASIPTPLDIWFPLVLLILFFFILILYNGHTRLQWLWLVLTGNASLGTGGGVPGFDVTKANQLLSDGSGVPGVDVNQLNQQLADTGPGTLNPNGTYGYT